MTVGHTEASNSLNLFDGLRKLISKGSRKHKIHEYTRYQNGVDYVFDAIDQGMQGQMTGQGRGVKVGDYITLKRGKISELYEIKTLDRYASPPDLWTAALVKVR